MNNTWTFGKMSMCAQWGHEPFRKAGFSDAVAWQGTKKPERVLRLVIGYNPRSTFNGTRIIAS